MVPCSISVDVDHVVHMPVIVRFQPSASLSSSTIIWQCKHYRKLLYKITGALEASKFTHSGASSDRVSYPPSAKLLIKIPVDAVLSISSGLLLEQ